MMKITKELVERALSGHEKFKNLDFEKIVDYVRYKSPENEIEQNEAILVAIRKQLNKKD